MVAFIKSPLGVLFGKGLGVITLKGRKTGSDITVPINLIEETDSFTIISKRDRTWWRNLRGGAWVALWTNGKNFTLNGSVFETQAELKPALSLFFTQHANMAKYFKVNFNPDGSLIESDLDRAVDERVLIRLQKSH